MRGARRSITRAAALFGVGAVIIASACSIVAGLDALEFVSECAQASDCPGDDPCKIAACVSGKCAPAPSPPGTLCASSDGRVCDGKGACVGCNVDEDCAGPVDDCQRPICGAGGICGVWRAEAGTATTDAPAQTPGDCHTIRCDGHGGYNDGVDDSDLPLDSVECTKDTCDAGVPFHEPLPAGSLCGAGGKLACDSAGNCTGCTLDAQCKGYDTCGGGGVPNACGCTKKTCATLGKLCGVHPDDCGGFLNCNDAVKDGDETDVDCGGTCSPCAQGKGCLTGSDCAGQTCVDGVCCNSTCDTGCVACNLPGSKGVCAGLPKGAIDPPACAGTKACNGAGLCLTAPGQPCDAGSTCASTFCADGVCCDLACNGTCQACNLPGHDAGACSYVAKYNADPDSCDDAGVTCNGNGACKRENGQPCTQPGQCASGACIDGVCCNGACTSACRACDLPGKVGTCSFLPNGTPDAPCDGGTCQGGACQ